MPKLFPMWVVVPTDSPMNAHIVRGVKTPRGAAISFSAGNASAELLPNNWSGTPKILVSLYGYAFAVYGPLAETQPVFSP